MLSLFNFFKEPMVQSSRGGPYSMASAPAW